jgi:transcriptional regulator with XRE-family HTH domain
MVAPRVEAVRLALGMSRTDFAALLGLDKSSYTKVAKGTKPLLPEYAYRLFRLYGVDLNFVYLGRVDTLPMSLSAKIIANLNGAQQ